MCPRPQSSPKPLPSLDFCELLESRRAQRAPKRSYTDTTANSGLNALLPTCYSHKQGRIVSVPPLREFRFTDQGSAVPNGSPTGTEPWALGRHAAAGNAFGRAGRVDNSDHGASTTCPLATGQPIEPDATPWHQRRRQLHIGSLNPGGSTMTSLLLS